MKTPNGIGSLLPSKPRCATRARAAWAGPASAQHMGGDKPGKEKCYGVALKGQNDCAAGRAPTAPGHRRSITTVSSVFVIMIGSFFKRNSPRAGGGERRLYASRRIISMTKT
jgi:hypothetical protein